MAQVAAQVGRLVLHPRNPRVKNGRNNGKGVKSMGTEDGKKNITEMGIWLNPTVCLQDDFYTHMYLTIIKKIIDST